MNDLDEFAGLIIEPWNEQVIDTTKWRYRSCSQINEGFWRWGNNWARKATAYGWIPYYGKDTFIHWKQLRDTEITP